MVDKGIKHDNIWHKTSNYYCFMFVIRDPQSRNPFFDNFYSHRLSRKLNLWVQSWHHLQFMRREVGWFICSSVLTCPLKNFFIYFMTLPVCLFFCQICSEPTKLLYLHICLFLCQILFKDQLLRSILLIYHQIFW